VAWRKVPVLVIYGEQDQYVPDFVDKHDLVKQWQVLHDSFLPGQIARQSRFMVLQNANHEISNPGFNTEQGL
jgi:pimeloyl-ACP methyl ester carboxylesterase